MKKSIVWLASYPKSGNTWTRIFLANYLVNGDRPVPINQVHRFGMGDSIVKSYRIVAGRPIDAGDVRQTLALRPRVLAAIVANNADVNFVKTHNIRGKAFGVTLIPEELTRSAIYILRNPLDMLISAARHFGKSHAEMAEAIGREDHSSVDPTTVTQFLGSWSGHVKSWTAKSRYPVLVLRYEDMLEHPEEAFGAMVAHVGMPVDAARLRKAIRFSSFDELARQESAGGFVENSPKSPRFFNKGQSGQWRTELAPEIVARVRRDHERMMRKYGYLDD
ncbi:MAG: sulfotransferase domain-containing protein [Roseovarius sp.]